MVHNTDENKLVELFDAAVLQHDSTKKKNLVKSLPSLRGSKPKLIENQEELDYWILVSLMLTSRDLYVIN